MAETSITMPRGFSKLSKTDQIRYVQDLWDRISEANDEIPVPESHLRIVEARRRRHLKNPSNARPAHEILDRLGKKPR